MTARLALAFLLLAAVPAAHAQSSAEANSGLQFNFGSPGARSLGLGGAFVATADDATAVFANPAGLTQLVRTEVAIEARGFSYTNTYSTAGHGFGEPTNRGVDIVPGVVEEKNGKRLMGLSFASIVVPYGRWSVALYRHELANFRASSASEGVFFNQTKLGKTTTSRFFPSQNDLSLRIVDFGATAAYRLFEDVSIGVTVARQRAELDSTSRFYSFSSNDDIYSPAAYNAVRFVQEQHGHGNDIVIHGGLFWRISDRLSFGASYQAGSDFAVDVQPRPAGAPPGEFHVPAIHRAGIAYSLSYTRIGLEVDRIGYSVLTRGFIPVDGEEPLYRADDGTEIHLGVQHMIVAPAILDRIGYPLVLSAGVWRDPDHRIRYLDPSRPQSLRFHGGEDEYHFSVGATVAVGESHEIGVAYDFSRRQRTMSASVVVRF